MEGGRKEKGVVVREQRRDRNLVACVQCETAEREGEVGG